MKRVRSIFIAIALLAFADLNLAQDSLNVRQVSLLQYVGRVEGVVIVGAYTYFAYDDPDFSGLRIVQISDPAQPFEVGRYVTQSAAFGVAVVGDFAYLADGSGGLRVVDIRNPSNPVGVGGVGMPGSAHDVALSGNYTYVAATSGGLRVVNIANPVSPFEVGFCGTQGSAHGVAVSGNYAYVAARESGIRVVNASNPSAPVEEGYYDTPGDALDVTVAGNHAYVADGYSGLRVVDITNPVFPMEVGYYDTPGRALSLAISGNYAYVADDLSLRVLDIADPSSPVEVGFYNTPGSAIAVAVSGDYAYVADYHYFGIYDCSAAMGDPCVGDLSVTLTPNNPNFPGSQNVSTCARIVPGLFTQVVVPVSNSTNVPTVTVTAGCASEPDCTPAEGWNLAQPWQYDANTTSFFTTIMRVGGGCCVTLSLDYVLPVELLGFDAVSGDAQVLLRWLTASETGSDHFEIERNGLFAQRISAAGDATGHSYSWTDRTVSNGQTYHYALWTVEINGERNLLSETDATPRAGSATITEYALHGNYPNPFNPTTEIAFELPEAANVSLKVFDLMGREVAVLVNGEKPAGHHNATFNARDLPTGLYICRMTAGSFAASRKMMLIR